MRKLGLSLLVLGTLMGLGCDTAKKDGATPATPGAPAPVTKPTGPVTAAKDVLQHLRWIALNKDYAALDTLMPADKKMLPGNAWWLNNHATAVGCPALTPEEIAGLKVGDFVKLLEEKNEKDPGNNASEIKKMADHLSNPAKFKAPKTLLKEDQWPAAYKAGLYRCIKATPDEIWREANVTTKPSKESKDQEVVSIYTGAKFGDRRLVEPVTLSKKPDGSFAVIYWYYTVGDPKAFMKKAEPAAPAK